MEFLAGTNGIKQIVTWKIKSDPFLGLQTRNKSQMDQIFNYEKNEFKY